MSTAKKRNFHLWFSKLRCFPAAVKPSSPPQTSNKKPLSITHLENSDYSSTSTAADDGFFSDDSTSDSDAVVPDFSAAVASHRFFFSSPGCSNSIFDSSPDTHHSAAVSDAVHGGVKVRKVSVDPFVDFRASMQEMVEARDRPVDVRRDWQYLQELLLCYLQINPVDTHKFILKAFSDLVVYLLESSPESFSDHSLHRHNINSRSWLVQ
ncbi:transcription repressor OFP12-like [Benincasa hispida]|uniref:transcription repressor OFP12-like n=1 Tax=Benincasa hispida TaxID=102211 RepID=UPI0019013401|nr:transcription repressor OFP12-like [Benincasa hispida]